MLASDSLLIKPKKPTPPKETNKQTNKPRINVIRTTQMKEGRVEMIVPSLVLLGLLLL